jgi:FkbM family methyltransferase
MDQYDTFLDIGACIGDYSIWLQKFGYKCLAFEPVPANYHSLLMNRDLNNIEERLHIYNIGLGEKEEIVQFEVRDINKGASKVIRGMEAEDQNSGQIYPLDSIKNRLSISKQDRIIAKLDVEGYEMDVLKGAAGFIREQDDLMLIIEMVLSDRSSMINYLNQLADFEYLEIDGCNFAAIKR